MASSSKYTGYAKMAALELAEENLARDLGSAWKEDPNVVAEAMCASGLNASESAAIESTLGSYINNFTPLLKQMVINAAAGKLGVMMSVIRSS